MENKNEEPNIFQRNPVPIAATTLLLTAKLIIGDSLSAKEFVQGVVNRAEETAEQAPAIIPNVTPTL